MFAQEMDERQRGFLSLTGLGRGAPSVYQGIARSSHEGVLVRKCSTRRCDFDNLHNLEQNTVRHFRMRGIAQRSPCHDEAPGERRL